MTTEVASLDSSRKTNSYIGYLPLGRSGAALCISYDWTPLQSELMRKVVRLIVFILIGMLVTCTLILLFLRKVVIKPLSSVQLTLRDYRENKDSEAAAAHLKQITTQNEIGEVSGVIPSCIEEYLHIAAQGTIAEEAKLKVERIPAEIRCEACGKESRPGLKRGLCPFCGSTDIRIIRGREYFVDSLEVE